MRNIALQLAYDGSHFNGYQIQPEGRTVQKELESGLSKLLQSEIKTYCAGRTDAGVHALTQVINFKTEHKLPITKFQPALQHFLPDDIAIVKAFEVSEHFHARYSARARHYRYILMPKRGHHPFLKNYLWQYPKDLNPTLLKKVWTGLQGKHNFQAFCKSGSHRKNYVIDVHWAHFKQREHYYTFEIMADSFLYNMVRTLVGTALDINRGHFKEDHLSYLLNTQDRTQIGFTAPAQGLYFYNVIYPNEEGVFLRSTQTHALTPLSLFS